MQCTSNNNQQGMTLVEAVMMVAIYTILMLAIFAAITSVYRTNHYAMAQATEVDSARLGLVQWNRDSKEMTVAEDGNYPIRIIEPHRFGYFSDTEEASGIEYVEYVLSSTTLEKRTYYPAGNPATYNFTTPDEVDTISTYVQNLNQSTSTFAYYDTTGAPLSASSPVLAVRYIGIQLIVNVDPERDPGEFMIRSSVAPRNIKDNL